MQRFILRDPKSKVQGPRSTLFDWLRLVAATAVLVGHSYVLIDQQPPALFGAGIHEIGVRLFFLISGFLIVGSWQGDPDAIRFVIKRVRRIMPALIAVVIATVFVLGPAMTVDTDYFGDSETWKYFWRNILLLPYHLLPGVFRANPNSAINGSLWSLPVEALMYVLTPLLVFGGKWICVASATCLIVFPFTGEIAGFGLTGASSVIPYFLIGAAAKLVGVHVPKVPLPRLDADCSYGLYLMAFPAQQTIISFYPGIDPAVLALATWITVIPLAWLSWSLIERPMLRDKPSIAYAST